MDILDILILIPAAWAGFQGFKKGLIYELAKIVALGLGIFAAIKFSEPVHAWLSEATTWDEKWLPAIAFGGTFLAVVIGVYYLGKILDSFIKAVQLGLVNRIAGAALGLLKMGLILSGLLMLLQSIDDSEIVITEERKQSSLLYQPVLEFGTTVIPAIKESEFYKQVKENFEELKEDVL